MTSAHPPQAEKSHRPSTAPSGPRPHRVVVLGAGFGGLQTVHALAGLGVEITLVDRRNYHLFQPLLYQVATTVLAASEIAWPIRALMKSRRDVTTLLASVADVEREAVVLEGGQRLPYDTLVVATGARHAYFGNEAWETVAPGLKTLEDAIAIRRKLLIALEEAELEEDPERRASLMTFAIIGGGPTGVELAGIIVELTHRIMRPQFRRIDTRACRIVLIETRDRLLGAFPETLSDYAATALRHRGVEIRFGAAVEDCRADGVAIGKDFIPCRTIIWAAGVAASPAAAWLGAPSDQVGRVIVAPDLTLAARPEVFVIGDTAAVSGEDGAPLPGIAPVAKQQGAYVGKVIAARLRGQPAPPPFAYRHYGNFATIGKRAAVVQIGGLHLRGALAWWVWGLAHILFLIGTRSRVSVVWSWLWNSLRGQTTARLITFSAAPKPTGSKPENQS